MEEVPRRTSAVPLAFPCFVLCLVRVEAEGLLDYQGRAGIISIVRWNLRPVIFGVESRLCLRGLGLEVGWGPGRQGEGENCGWVPMRFRSGNPIRLRSEFDPISIRQSENITSVTNIFKRLAKAKLYHV